MLRIDLLPRQIAIARMNKILVAVIIVLLLAEVGVLAMMLMGVRGQQAEAEEELAATTQIADQVRGLESEIASKEGDLAPIQEKIDFIEEANTSGEQYWDRFHAINEYIYENAQMTRFSLTGSGSVNFTVIVGDTTEAARFMLNLVHCPALSGISISGLPPGISIEGVGGARVGTFQPMGGPEDMMMDDPGMMDEGIGPMGVGPVGRPTVDGEITLNVTATLTESVSEPTPGPAAAAPGMPGMPPGMDPGMDPGMMEPEMMEEDMMME